MRGFPDIDRRSLRSAAMTRVAVHQLAPVLGDLEGNRARAAAAIEAAAAAGADVVVLPELVTRATSSRGPTRRGRSPSPPTGRPCRRGRGWRRRTTSSSPAASRSSARTAHALQQRRAGRRVRRPRRLPQGPPVGPRAGVLPARRRAPAGGRHAARPDRADGLLRPRVPRVGARGRARRAPSCSACRPTGPWSRGRTASGRWRSSRRWSTRPRTGWRSPPATAAGPSAASSWVSGSAIAGPDGWLLAGPPGPEPALLVADVDLAATRDKALGPRNDVHADRRPALYRAAH